MAGLCHKQLRCVRNVAPARHRPVAPAVPARARIWRGVCHVAQTVEAPAQNVSKVAALTEALMIEEANLAQMFESGRPMPRAGIVNAAREKIASLKAELAALIQGVEPPSRSAPTAMTHISATVQPLMDVEDVEMIEKARLLLDGVTTRRDPNWVPISDSEVPVQLCILEAENQRLRKVATALIRRQQQLEELVAGLLAPFE